MLYVYVYYVWVCCCVCVGGVTLIFGGNRSLLGKCVNCSRIMRYHLKQIYYFASPSSAKYSMFKFDYEKGRNISKNQWII